MDTAPDETPRRIEYMVVTDLQPAPRNPKLHDDEAIDASIGKWGYTEPMMLDDRTGLLIAGHGRQSRLAGLEAMGDEPPNGIVVGPDGRWMAPVVRGWSSIDDDDAAGYLVASNRLVERGGWDPTGLGELLGDIGPDLTELAGWTLDELGALGAGGLGPTPDFDPTPLDEQPELDKFKPITCPECGHQFDNNRNGAFT